MIQKAIKKYLERNGLASMNPKAVLFDMDGILYDSMPYHAKAWQETATRHCLRSTPELFYLFEGCTGDSMINELFQRTYHHDATEEERKAIYEEKAELFNRYNKRMVMNGALDVLETVKKTGLKSSVVTGSGQHSLFEKLNKDFPDYFDPEKIITAYDVKQGKPHPEPYLTGLKKVNIQSNEAFVVENAPMGVKAGVAAGIFTIAVNTGPLDNKILLDAGADLLCPDMKTLAHHWENIYKIASETKV